MTTPDAAVPSRPSRRDRLHLRTTERQKQLIERAAAALDKSLTDFVLDSASERAEQVLADRRRFVVDDEAWTRLEELLDAPAEDLPRLRQTLHEPTVFDAS